ncbi:MAG: YidC/Oxa1 family membrane protein insertase [Candidatus Limnocylindrales bacterium]
MRPPRPNRSWAGPLLLMAIVALVLAACAVAPGASPAASLAAGTSAGASAAATATPLPTPLRPASLGADPFSLLAFAFTPIFQLLFIILVAFYRVVGDIGIAILLLTIVIRIPLIPLFRRQIVSMRSTQLLAPQVKEIQRRYKGDRQKIFEETQAMYRASGVSQFSGCLPILLQMPLLFVMYQVIREGLTSYDITPMLSIAGQKLIDISCAPLHEVNGVIQPCINTSVAWLGGLDAGRSHIDFAIFGGFGISFIAILSAVLQIFQSRMTLPPLDKNNPDPNARIQRQTMLFLPLIFIFYANILPAGLYIYYIASTIISIIQQYLIVGWGSTFPFFGWDPAFARAHTPRFPVAPPAPLSSTRAAGAPARPTAQDRAASAASTVRPHERGRQGRRGRRR